MSQGILDLTPAALLLVLFSVTSGVAVGIRVVATSSLDHVY